MRRLLQSLPALLLALPAWALDPTPARAAESPVALVMYLAVGAVLAVGFLYVWFRSKKDRERERRRNAARSG